MKDVWGWVVGIGTCIAIYLVGSFFLELIGVPTWIDFGRTISVSRGSGRYRYEEDIDGEATAIGLALMIIGILVGCYTGVRAAGNPVSPKDLLQGKAIIGGFAIYGVGAAIAFKLFPGPGMMGWVVDLAIAAIAFFVMRDWYGKRVAALNTKPSNPPQTT